MRIKRYFIRKIRKVLANCIRLMNVFSIHISKEIIRCACFAYNKDSDEFIECVLKPKKTKNINCEIVQIKQVEKIAVILQGPIDYDEDFTLETLIFYKKTFAYCEIILSTWKTERRDYIKKIKSLGIHVVLNELPQSSGMGNINYQLASTLGGIEFAKSLGMEYVLKTRTDQRLYRNNLGGYFISLIKMFPLQKNIKSLCQNKRIVALGGGNSMFLPFNICDFMYFGCINDMEKLFSQKMSMHHFANKTEYMEKIFSESNMTIGNWILKTFPEAIIFVNYLKDNSVETEASSVKFYWDFVKGYLIMLSQADVALYWHKYTEERVFNKEFEDVLEEEHTTNYRWSFVNWLSLYNGLIKYEDDYEYFSNREFYKNVKY